MGALTPARRDEAMERYAATESVGEKPLYACHNLRLIRTDIVAVTMEHIIAHP